MSCLSFSPLFVLDPPIMYLPVTLEVKLETKGYYGVNFMNPISRNWRSGVLCRAKNLRFNRFLSHKRGRNGEKESLTRIYEVFYSRY